MTAFFARRGNPAPEAQAGSPETTMTVSSRETSNFFLFVIMPLLP